MVCCYPWFFSLFHECALLSDLPEQFCNDVFVRFKFFDDVTYETPVCPKRTTSPVFNHCTVIKFSKVFEEHLQFLLRDAIVFEVCLVTDSFTAINCPLLLPHPSMS